LIPNSGYSVRIGLPNCFVDEDVRVTICPTTLFVPNAFTPNGDGLNDVFKPVGIRVSDYRFQVYDKWGKLSFDTNNFDEGWQGAEYPADVYYYWITYTDSDGGSQSQKGTVQLLR
ncbi:MAG TPA: hypothetical protein DIU05_10080, partial [Bacteroidetes bacterium]|nr:hypothetical protein [Bacteroidota bacterium]